VSGEELTRRAFDQARLFGAEILFLQRATGLHPKDHEIEVSFSDCGPVRTSTVVVATGVESRRLGVPSVEQLVGRGVYYAAPGVEAPALADEHVFVVGGGNSAAQAALQLAQYAASVTMLVRGDSLVDSTSSYLIVELDATENVTIRTQAQVVEAIGSHRLQGLIIESAPSGNRDEVDAAGLFILIGAETQTEWLRGTLALDDRGYILTGRNVPPASRAQSRAPLPFETSMPNVFAVGDVRNGSSKRVAAAVGEGSVAIGSVRHYLADMRAA
jgi:thioredoxin reductase (NADPH)